MSVMNRIRSRLSIAPTLGQPYDPELAAIDANAMDYSKRRLGLGFGAPPVVPYGQRLGMMGAQRRMRLLSTFPALNNFPMIKRLLEARY